VPITSRVLYIWYFNFILFIIYIIALEFVCEVWQRFIITHKVKLINKKCHFQYWTPIYIKAPLLWPFKGGIKTTIIVFNGNTISLFANKMKLKYQIYNTRLVIGTSRTVGSAKKFVMITSGFGGGEFMKTFRKVCTCQKLKFSFLLLEYCKIRECYAVANAFTIRNMYSLFLHMIENLTCIFVKNNLEM
jgi:hypothetical protein